MKEQLFEKSQQSQKNRKIKTEMPPIKPLDRKIYKTVLSFYCINISQLHNIYKNITTGLIKKSLNKLCNVYRLLDSFEYQNYVFYTPKDYRNLYKKLGTEELERHIKVLDVFSYFYRQNTSISDKEVRTIIEPNFVSKFPIVFSFIYKNEDLQTHEKKYMYFDILYVPEGEEGNANYLGKRIFDDDSEDAYKIIIIENKEQISKIKMDNVLAFYRVSENGIVFKECVGDELDE